MNTFDLGKILDEIHWEEYAELDNPPHRIKSLRHRLRMRRIMKQALEKQDKPIQRTRMKLSPRKVLILLVLIFTAIIAAAAVVVWHGNFYGQRHFDNTEMFAAVSGAPETIEEIYELTEIPEGYEYCPDESYGNKGDYYISTTYINPNDNGTILLSQSTRRAFTCNVDINRTETTGSVINGKKAVITRTMQNGEVWNFVFYDAEDYILTISTCLPPDSAIDMLKSAKIKKL